VCVCTYMYASLYVRVCACACVYVCVCVRDSTCVHFVCGHQALIRHCCWAMHRYRNCHSDKDGARDRDTPGLK